MKNEKVLLLVVGFLLAFSFESSSQVLTQEQINEASDSKSVYLDLKSQGANFYETQAAFNAYWENREVTKGQGYKPFRRWESFMEERVYPSGDMFPSNAINEAGRQMTQAASLNDNPYAWTNNGPEEEMGNGNGRISKVRIDPSNPSTYYACAPGGGIWRSLNAGDSWAILETDTLPIIGFSDVAVNGNVIYAASGDHDYGNMYSLGILKSTDAGETWEISYDSEDGLFEVNNGNGSNVAWADGGEIDFTISRILISPNDDDKVVASTQQGILYTTDGGDNWAFGETTAGDAIDEVFHDIEFKPGDPSIVYACGNGIFYRSTNFGANWTQVEISENQGEMGRCAIAVSANEPNWIYMIATKSSALFGFYKSINSGASWTEVNDSEGAQYPNILSGQTYDGTGSGGQGSYDLCISVHPNNADSITVGGVNLYNSSDGGDTWDIIAHWVGNGWGYDANNEWGSDANYSTIPKVHADHHGLTYAADGTLIIANDGGVYTSTNGSTFENKSEGLFIGQIYRLNVAQDQDDLVVSGLQDCGTQKMDGSFHQSIMGGDGMDNFIVGQSSFPQADNGWLAYTGVQFGVFARKTAAGSTTIARSDGDGVNDGGAWITPLRVDPENEANLYIVKSHVYKSENYGNDWVELAGDEFPSNPSYMAVSWVNPNYIYISKWEQLWKSTNGGASYTRIGQAALPNRHISDLELDPTDPERLFIAYSTFYEDNKIYKTDDAGATFTNMSEDLPHIPMDCIHYRKGSSDDIFVGTDVGVYRWNGSKWNAFNLGLPNVIVQDLEIMESSNVLHAGTYGRGQWTKQLLPIYELVLELETDEYSCADSDAQAWTITDSGGDVVASGSDYECSAEYSIDIPALADGCYTFEITDLYGDGMAGNSLNNDDDDGSYAMVLNGETLFSGTGNWGASSSHEFCLNGGCMDDAACNFDASANLELACDFTSCVGCMDDTACNYDESYSTDDPASCEFTSCVGCMDESACNYGADFTVSDEESCGYIELFLEINPDPFPDDIGWSLTDDDSNIIITGAYPLQNENSQTFCVALGCYTFIMTDSWGDGLGGTSGSGPGDYSMSLNGNTLFSGGGNYGDEDENEFCLTEGCMDSNACNFNSAATISLECTFADGICETCSGENDGTGTVVDNDSDGDNICNADEVAGCQESAACNYNSQATDAGSCIFAEGICETCSGENDGTGTVVDNDSDGDNICNANEVVGCQESAACNYNSQATDAGSCIFADGICETCSGEADGTGTVVDNDSDGDNICNANEVVGCQESAACNYNSQATDAGSCIFAEGICETCSGENDGTGTVVDNDSDGDDVCNADEVVGCQDSAACDYDVSATDEGSCDYSCIGCMDESACNYEEGFTVSAPETCGYINFELTIQPDDYPEDIAWSLTLPNNSIVTGGDLTDSFTQAFCYVPGCYTFVITDSFGDGICCEYGNGFYTIESPFGTVFAQGGEYESSETSEFCSIPYGCTDETACNYDCEAVDEDGSCLEFSSCGICGGSEPDFAYDCQGACLNDTDNDGVCDPLEVAGCTTPSACNYNAAATDDDGNCTYADAGYDCAGECLVDSDGDDICDQDEVAGCQDEAACNYEESATDEGYCHYAATNYDCDGNCLNDTDNDGVCDELEVAGCTSPSACNYNAAATDDDGNCTYADAGYDCAGECLVDSDGDDICDQDEVAGCQDEAACNYEESATDEGYCHYAATNYDCDGNCLNDTDNDGVCDPLEVAGCTAPSACNYNANATDDDGNCTYADAGYDCAGECLVDSDGDDICDQDEVAGCQDEAACNYEESATDEGYCHYAATNYDCDGNCLNDTDNDGVCDPLEVAGCTAPSACNYNAAATDDDGNCTYADAGYDCAGECLVDSDGDDICDQDEVAGCQDEAACNYEESATDEGYCHYAATNYDCDGNCLNDTDNDGVCDPLEVAGCTAPSACNYNATATDDDGNCTYADAGYDCAGECLVDSDGDDICDQDEVAGCQDEAACNYEESATDEGYCHYAATNYDCDGNCLNDTDNDGVCDPLEVAGCTAPSACNYDATATDDDGNCTYADAGYDCAGECLVDSDGDDICDQDEVAGCQDEAACNYEESATDEGYCHYAATNYDCDGNCLNDTDNDGVCDPLEVAGCTAPSACNYDATATDDDGNCTYADAGYDCAGECLVDSDGDDICDQDEVAGCQDEAACNYEESATDEGYCHYAATNYDCDGNCLNDTDNDGVCDPLEVAGCTAPSACNYDATATDDDGNCTYADAGYDCAGECLVDSDGDDVCDQDEVAGCQDEAACNYEESATDEGYCHYAATNYDCDGNCINDTDNDGVCDPLEVAGCTAPSACNYDATATDDDGNCTYADAGYDCAGECLVDSDGDDICDQDEVAGCQDEAACNYEESATDEGYCHYAATNYDCDGNCLNDTDNDGVCDPLEVAGCTAPSACNYDATATDDDGNCTYADAGYDCAGECLVDSDGDDVCDQDEVTGCQDEAACNYEESATDEGYCHYAATNYDCDGNCINDMDNDGVCDPLEVAGCTSPSACNYNAAATDDDGNCTYADAGYDCAGNCLFDSDGDDICDWIELEALIEALTAGIYCGEGTLWVEAAQTCLPMEMCVGDLDGDGTRGTGDLLLFLGLFGTDCE